MTIQNNLDALRVFFTLIIVYFHMVRVYLVELFPGLFNTLAQQIERAYLFVEFFFLLSGYFLCFSLKKDNCFFDFIKRKIIRLWPVFAFSIICGVISVNGYNRYEIHILDLLLLQGSGLLHEQGANFNAWYVSSLFIGMIVYGYFLKHYTGKNAICYIILLVYLSLYCIVHGTFDTYTNMLLRSFVGLGIGYLLSSTFSSRFVIQVGGVILVK